MIVDDLRVAETDEKTLERSARVRWRDGDARLRIRTPAEFAAEADDASPYLAAALQLAMRRREDLEVDGAVSPRLLANTEHIQNVYGSWDARLRPVEVRVAAEREPTPGAGLSGCFFSRGVDSTYCATSPRAEEEALDRLVFADDIEVYHDEQVLSEERRLTEEAARALGLPLVLVSTNVRELSEPLCDWEDMAGAGLAFIALSLARGLARVVIPPSDSPMTLTPCGTSPLLDPLFSTETVAIKHDILEHTRTQKVAHIVARRPDLVPYLKVCIAENRPDNCGRCPKCLQTMAGLLAAGALEQAAGFPDRIDPAAVDAIYLDATSWIARYELAELGRALPAHGEVGEIREKILARVADRGLWVDPYLRSREQTFRHLHALTIISLTRDGRPNPPLADADARLPRPPGWTSSLGLVRALDPVAARHLYGVGSVPPGRLVGELGSMLDRPGPGRVAGWLTDEGYLVTEAYCPELEGAPPRLLARWALAPLSWRGSERLATRARTVLWRIRRTAAGWPVGMSTPSGDPIGYLYTDDGEHRRALYSALHPVTGDQLLSSSEREAADMGYTGVRLVGFLDALAPVTGRLAMDRPMLPWASRLGEAPPG